jgi:DNA-binding response OmpR family regulator
VRALVLEDDVKLMRFLVRVLSEEGFVVDECSRGVDAIERARRGSYDLILLDWVVPETDGLSVCREVRRAGVTAPILMLTARREVRERVLGLLAGADDYVSKPFEVDELVARIRALVRRASGFGPLRCGELEIDLAAREAKVAGAPLALTQREYGLLLRLAHRAGYVVERAELLAHVWGIDVGAESNLVEVHVGRLRRKLGSRGWMIETVRDVGYRLTERKSSS